MEWQAGGDDDDDGDGDGDGTGGGDCWLGCSSQPSIQPNEKLIVI